LKLATVLAQVAEVAAEVATPVGTVDTHRVEQLTGRLTAISMHEPQLLGVLHGGYTIVSAAMRASRRARLVKHLPLREQSRATLGLRRLVQVAKEALEANEGIPLASPSAFPPLGSPGLFYELTDASRANRDDGVGGFGFHPDLPLTVFMLSVSWPADIKVALDFAALPRAQQAARPGHPSLSMPCAEAFGGWVLPCAVAAATRLDISAVVAVGDCEPAAAAYNKASSSVPQIAAILLAMRELTTQWLGVAVRRDFNFDADRLSHPSMLPALIREAVAAGLSPVVLTVPDWAWDALRAASHMSRMEEG
jgi:hypothetical protein